MDDPLAKLDHYIESLGPIADALEQQVGPCPTTRPVLIAWLTQIKQTDLARMPIGKKPPSLPASLKAAYRRWAKLGARE
ncbi:hypothetical protein GEV39_13455 [Pseudomonas sp. NY5710]|nr:hypothetical protein GEV39_13455 [Pseudomonas sp. NY5710]